MPGCVGRGLSDLAIALLRFSKIFLSFAACLYLTGGPYGIMQCYAWLGMIVSYSQQDGLARGIEDTFSGERPCGMCVKIAAAKKAESSKDPLAPGHVVERLKLSKEWQVPILGVLVFPSGEVVVHQGFVCPDGPAPCEVDAPPVPPPRSGSC
jgi:hypothetical protein